MKKYIFLVFTSVYSTISLFAADQVPEDKMDSVALKELVVQASRDGSQLKKLPGSVSVLTTNHIQTLGINNLTDVTSHVPNLFMPDYGSKLTSPIYIRGVGSRINSPSVGLYVDNVPYFEKAAFNFDFFDIGRIEVLRGPQGTQYGRNTMAGIVNIITKSPLNYQGNTVTLQAGTYGSYLLNLGKYAKINDKLAYSVSLNYRYNDGYYYNEYLKESVDVLNSLGLRNRLIWLVNEQLTVENILSYEHSVQGGYPYAVYNEATQKAEPIFYNQASGYNRNLLSDALLLKYNADEFDFKSTSSYQYLSDKQSIDQDFTKDSLYFVVQTQKQHLFSQEFTIHSKGQKKYSWLLGVYGFMQQFYNDVNADVYASKTTTSKIYEHQIAGGALFHQSGFRNFPFKNMNTTLGIRFDSEADQLGYKYDRLKNNVLSNLADTVYKSLNSFQVLPKLTVNYQTASTNVYALVSRGYKTGGFNSTFERPEDLTFEPEYSWNYELGMKTSFFKNKLYLESSLFYIDWRKQQIYKTVPSGTGSMLKNAGRSVSKGAELSLSSAVIYGFDFMLNYGYTHATFLSNVLNSTTDYSGNYIPYVPRHTVALQAKKAIDIEHSLIIKKIILSAVYKGTGEIYWDEKNSHKQGFYGLLDARVSFVRDNLKLELWGSNLTSTSYETFYFEALGRKYVQMGRPMQAGVKLLLNF